MPKHGRGDAGANMIEKVALTIIVAGVLAGLGTAFSGPIADNFAAAVCKVLNSGDGSDCETPSDEEFKPVCTMSQESNSVGGQVEVAFFNLNQDYGLMKTVTYDPATGEKTVKVTGIKGKGIGAGTGFGGGTEAGLANASADASADVNLKGSLGESWSFTGDGADGEANALIEDMQEQYGIDAVKENSLGGWVGGSIYEAAAGPDIPEPSVHTYEAELSGSLSGTLGATLGPKDKSKPGGKHEGKGGRHGKEGSEPTADPGAKGYVSLDASEKVSYEINDKTGEESATFMLKFGGTMGGQLGGDDKQSDAHGTGSLRVTKDADGKMKSVTLTSIQMVDGKAEQTTTVIPTPTDAEREIVANKLANLEDPLEAGVTTAKLTVDDLVQTEDPGPDGDAFEKLMYDTGKTSKINSTYDTTNESYGANVKLGLKAGVGLNFTGSSQQTTDAAYLGAPAADGTREYKNYDECAGKERKKGKGVEKNGKPAP